MFKVAVGHSNDPSVEDAMNDVLDQIRGIMGDIRPQAGLLLCSVDFDHAYIVSTIRREYPGIELAGCTTDGEMSSVGGFTEDSVTLMVFASDTVEIRAGMGKNTSAAGRNAGHSAALNAKSNLTQCRGQERFAVIMVDPLNAGTSEIDTGIQEVLGETFPLIGGASAAHSKRRTTFQFCNDEIATGSVVLLLFAGPIQFSCGIKGGLAPIAGKEVVTSAKKNVLYRIGERTALDYFRRYIGENYNLFMNYCLAVFEKKRSDGFYVRSAPFHDAEAGTVTLNGIVPEGSSVQLGTCDKNICIQSCAESIRIAKENYPGLKPACALFFSCAGRKMILGTQVILETETVKTILNDLPFCGYYGYGEIGPMAQGDHSLFHGTTFITLLFGTDE
jgi:hypothetical protein